jgi:DNA repair exonuclease SbcCD nuclease subunit
MKILHTADVHLRELHDERWKCLLHLLEIGKKEKIDALAICGDLFDKGIDAEKLRPHIREVFSKTGFKILILPGNHDAESFESGLYYGEDAVVFSDVTLQDFDNVRIIGIPYEPLEIEQVYSKVQALKGRLKEDGSNILMYHGELLDLFFSREDMGNEGHVRYMPIKASFLENLKIDYVLAGHFHTRFDTKRLNNNCLFIYPGSPVSVTRAESSQRKANLLVVGQQPREYPLDTFHYQEVIIEFDPFTETNPIDLARERMGRIHPQARALFTFWGYINSQKIGMSETELVQKLKALTKGKCDEEPTCQVADIKRILENDIFRSFREKVDSGNYDQNQKKSMVQIAIRAMMEALS